MGMYMDKNIIKRGLYSVLVCLLIFPFKFTHAVPFGDTQAFNGHQYYLWPQRGLTWAQAQPIAARQTVELPDGRILKGHLLTVNSQAEQDFISNTYLTQNWLKIWLGGFEYSNADEPAGFWAWLTGEEMGHIHNDWSYTFLQYPEPSNNPNNPINSDEDVLKILINLGSGTPPGTGNDRWHDFHHDNDEGTNTGLTVIEFDEFGDNFICFNLPPKVPVLSGRGWRTSDTLQEGWETVAFDDSSWPQARAPYPNPNPPTNLLPGTTAQHMWHDPNNDYDGKDGPDTAYFRYQFKYNPAPGNPAAQAVAKITVDDDYWFYVNGNLVFVNNDGGNADQVDVVDFSPYIQAGTNVLAIKAVDSFGIWERVLFDATISTGPLDAPLVGDLNGDCCVDRGDFNLIISEIRSPTPNESVYDLNNDGVVNIADARFLVTRFTNPRGAACY